MTTLPNNKKIVILGGGTNSFISNHLSLAASAYGQTAKKLYEKFSNHLDNKMQTEIILTRMADPSKLTNSTSPDTPEDVEALVDKLIADPDTRVIIFNVAMVDFKPVELTANLGIVNTKETFTDFGKYNRRISSNGSAILALSPHDKIIQKIRKERKDILLVGFKTTCGATKEEQFQKGLKLCKDASANIVFVNDVDKDRIKKLNDLVSLDMDKEFDEESPNHGLNLHYSLKGKDFLLKDIQSLQNNGLVTPEESSYWYNTRDEALDALVQMVLDRSQGEFVRTTIV